MPHRGPRPSLPPRARPAPSPATRSLQRQRELRIASPHMIKAILAATYSDVKRARRVRTRDMGNSLFARIGDRVAIRSRDMGDSPGKEVWSLALEGDVTHDAAEAVHRCLSGAGGEHQRALPPVRHQSQDGLY